ncbi:MAG: AbrB/MazE/SpoVT family DNA-binding domain-containing protein [Bacteroidetes bacterium]|nr:AbrB/MazE/SpoVT family DNA-binding domain-containing protein [Bacteroidota bacterium]
MHETTKIRKFGGSYGLILPKSVIESMAVKEGDVLYVSGSPDGLTATPYDPEFADAMTDAREFMRTHRDAFRELAR